MDSEKKYIEFSDNCAGAGYGNQLRAFIKAVILADITKRELIVSNYWIKTLFNCPYDYHWDRNINRKNKIIKKIYGNIPFEKSNFNEIKEDIIEVGGGDLPVDIFLTNHNYNTNFIIRGITSEKYKYFQATYQKYLSFLNADFISKSKKIIDYDKEKYISIQFRTFHDAGRRNMFLLNDFIKNCINTFKKENIDNLPVFITTDDKNITNKISEEIKKTFNTTIIKSPYNIGHSRNNKNMEILCDWLINGKSQFIYTTGTTYSLTSSILFDTKCMIYGKKYKNVLVKDLNNIMGEF